MNIRYTYWFNGVKRQFSEAKDELERRFLFKSKQIFIETLEEVINELPLNAREYAKEYLERIEPAFKYKKRKEYYMKQLQKEK